MATADSLSRQFHWQPAGLPYLELRETLFSRIPYRAHSHAAFSIGAVTDGVTQLTLGANRQLLIERGELIMIAPDCVHRCNPVADGVRSYLMLYINADWLLNQARDWYGPHTAAIRFHRLKSNDVTQFEQFIHFAGLLKRDQLAQAEAALIALLRQLVRADQVNGTSTPASWRTRQIKQTFARTLEHPPSLTTLARHYHVCPETLIRTFKQQTGLSPKAYLNNVRIERAKQLLKNGCTASEVTYRLGFADQSHFQKTFMHYTAQTPGQYQRGFAAGQNDRHRR